MPRAVYVELAPDPALADVVACEWQRSAETTDHIEVLPDGCVDIVWRSDGELFVAGPDRGRVAHPQAPGIEFAGVRIRPGAAASVLGTAVDELCDRRVPLADLWGRTAVELANRLGEATTGARRRRTLVRAVRGRIADATLDGPVLAAVQALGSPGMDATGLPGQVGLSPRQLRRRFVLQVGYGPKTYERVMRFRRFLAGAGDDSRARRSMAALAADAGFADQAHLSRECRRLAGRTPAQLVRSHAADRAVGQPARRRT